MELNSTILMRLLRDRKLSAREAAVVVEVVQGFADKEIAHRIGISERTVKEYERRARLKLSAQNRTQLVAAAMEAYFQGGDSD